MKYKHFLYMGIGLLSISSSVDAAQRCKGHKISTAPTSNFSIDSTKGVVTQGSLMWKRCAEGQSLTARGCENKASLSYFTDVKDQKVRFAGYSDWRLPTIDELKGIVEKQCKGPAMNLEVFPNSPNLILWSGSVVDNRDDKVWVMFSSTGVAIKSNIGSTALVRLVRDIN